MNVDVGIWGKLTNFIAALVVLAIVLLIGLSYLPLIHENERMRAEIDRLDAQLQAEEQKSQQLQEQIEALRNDPQAVERLAREKLGYARPDETVIHFVPPLTNTATR